MTCAALPSVISSPVLAGGPTLCSSPEFRQADLFGPVVAPANLTASPVSKKPTPTIAICGLNSTDLSPSAVLSQSLVSKLKTQLSTVGLTEYKQTWKLKATPLGLSYWAHTASAHRTSDNAYSGWPTATANDHNRYPDPETKTSNVTLNHAAGWATPQARDHFPAHTPDYYAAKKAAGHGMANLNDQAVILAGYPTPRVSDMNGGKMPPGKTGGPGLNQMVAFGEIIGSPAQTEKRGVLNPELARWLMGYPPAWCDCAVTAMQSTRK